MAEQQGSNSAADGSDDFQVLLASKETPPAPIDSPSMKVILSTFPGLGQITQICQNTIVFTALLEIDVGRTADPWQVSLWHSEGTEWQETPMVLSSDQKLHPISLQSLKLMPNIQKLCFTTPPLAIRHMTNFTVKFRNGPHQSWKWVKEHEGTPDGTVLLKSAISQDTVSNDLGDYIEGLNPLIRSRHQRSQSPGTTLWSLEAPIDAADGEKSNVKDIKLGIPWGLGKFSRWFALIRIWSPWLAPRQGREYFGLDKEAVLCSFLSKSGKHLVLLAISGIDDVMTLFTSVNGVVNLHVKNDSSEKRFARVLVGLGENFESATAAVMYHARSFVATKEAVSGELRKELEAIETGDEVTKVWAENWYDGLTYCTWNALGQRLTEEKVLEAVDTLAKNKINVTNFIIDDNWQSIDYRGHGQFQHGWNEFEAEPQAFPNGLKHLVSRIKEKHPSIQHVAVWHAILGYWGGLSPDGKLAKTYKTVEVVREDAERRNLPLGGKLTVVAKQDIPRFYDDFYSFLASCGIDAVKTDAQFMLDTLVSAEARRDLIPTYLDAWTISTLRHFGVKAISCMSQTPQILFHSQLPQNRPPILVRNSDDFFPDVPASHPWHIWTNAHNALFTQHLNLLPDWDMFQTVHEYSGYHAAARCVSGGPIYITDVPGQHDFNLINQMTGPTPRGMTVIFRPSVVGKSLDQYNGYDDDKLLLVGTYHGAAVTGTGIIGSFNVSQRQISELIPLSKFPGVVEAQLYVVRAHSSGRVSPPIQVVNPSSLIYLSLPVRGYEILSAYPLRGFYDAKFDSTTWIANLGLLGKMAGAAAIVDNKITKLENDRIVIDTNIKALGTLGIYISTLPITSFLENIIISILGQVIPVHTVNISEADTHVLEIDVERAWKEMELDSGWSNEVEVKIYINPSQ